MAYKLHYSDYPGTDTGPPDPERWVGPPGPTGPVGPAGPPGPITTGGAANVIDFGADPTGVADSSAAINAAAAVVAAGSTRHKAVYLPTGTYRVNAQINLTAAQAMYGDSRGSSVLLVDQNFSPSATAVIFITAAFYDQGPVLRDFGITFSQPSDQGSRGNFKTLAAGGTSGAGGTGVAYPWAIASGSDNFRIQCIRLRIGGAWDGITTNGHNTVYWLDDIEMGALDCGVSLGEGAGGGVQDFVHINQFHFWNFDLYGSLWNVYSDGQTISLRVGRCDGLNITGFGSFCARVVFVGDAGFTNCHIVNAMLDGDPSAIEINSPIEHLHISNIYGTAGANRVRPFIAVAANAIVRISNWYSHSSSNYPDLLVTAAGADVILDGFYCLFNATATNWVSISRGFLQLLNGRLQIGSPRTVAAIAETLAGTLVLDNVMVEGSPGSGPLLSAVNVHPWTVIGRLGLEPGNTWTFSLPAGLVQTFYSLSTIFRGGLTATGMTIGSSSATAANVQIQTAIGNARNLVFAAGNSIRWVFSSDTNETLRIDRYNASNTFIDTPFAINPGTGGVYYSTLAATASYTSDATAAAGGVGVGQLYRNGSAVMVRVA